MPEDYNKILEVYSNYESRFVLLSCWIIKHPLGDYELTDTVVKAGHVFDIDKARIAIEQYLIDPSADSKIEESGEYDCTFLLQSEEYEDHEVNMVQAARFIWVCNVGEFDEF